MSRDTPANSDLPAAATTPAGALVSLTGIDKRFGGVRALRGVDVAVNPGEIMGLCGENGAGKSTLIKILAGVHPADSYQGVVRVGGEERRFFNPVDAQRAGIAVVHQELVLVPELSVAQNLLLGREPRRFGLVDDTQLEVLARELLERFGFARYIDPARPVAELGIGLQQVVEIIRALSQDAKILVLDEPTAALTVQETDQLLAWLRRLREQGTTCVYVSHRLDEVFDVCDRISVLRDGRSVATVVASESSANEVVRLMVGREVEHGQSSAPPSAQAVPALELRGFHVLRAKASGGVRYAVEDVSLSVAEGEIVAVCGAMGSGRTALLSSLFGCAHAGTLGEVRVGGAAVTPSSPREAIAHGIALVPEDRRGLGLVVGMTVAENLALPSLTSSDVMGASARVGLVDASAEAKLAERRIAELGIRGAPSSLVATLSGGNQQKVVLGKWLERPPKVLLLDEPTRGVDVGAREEIYAILERLAAKGVAILFASSDLVEVLRLAQRLIVLRQGRIAGEMPAAGASEAAIVELSTGAERQISTQAEHAPN